MMVLWMILAIVGWCLVGCAVVIVRGLWDDIDMLEEQITDRTYKWMDALRELHDNDKLDS